MERIWTSSFINWEIILKRACCRCDRNFCRNGSLLLRLRDNFWHRHRLINSTSIWFHRKTAGLRENKHFALLDDAQVSVVHCFVEEKVKHLKGRNNMKIIDKAKPHPRHYHKKLWWIFKETTNFVLLKKFVILAVYTTCITCKMAISPLKESNVISRDRMIR